MCKPLCERVGAVEVSIAGIKCQSCQQFQRLCDSQNAALAEVVAKFEQLQQQQQQQPLLHVWNLGADEFLPSHSQVLGDVPVVVEDVVVDVAPAVKMKRYKFTKSYSPKSPSAVESELRNFEEQYPDFFVDSEAEKGDYGFEDMIHDLRKADEERRDLIDCLLPECWVRSAYKSGLQKLESANISTAKSSAYLSREVAGACGSPHKQKLPP